MPLAAHPNASASVLDHFSLKGKVCVVTGGARGIGEQIVRAFAEAGADVALIFRTTAGSEVAETIARDTGRRVEAFQADVTRREEIAECIQKITKDFGKGRLDVVVANAGVCANIPSLEYTEEQWSHNNSVNIDGVMWTAQAAGKIFREQGFGNLIITASVSATLVNIPQTQAAYNSSKAAAKHLGKSLAVEWVDFARVNVVSPGFIGTPMLWMQPQSIQDQWMALVPGRRVAEPAELKGVSLLLHVHLACRVEIHCANGAIPDIRLPRQ
jgi:sorbose reductase